MLRQIALVSQSVSLSTAELALGSAALQRQVTRDLAAHWQIAATVDSFDSLEQVPAGYWPIVVMDQINQPGAEGYHTDQNGQPFALVEYSTTWTLTASHELIEMLIDPYGKTLVPGRSLDPDHSGSVRYLLEACDPCEDPQFAYSINGHLVSDFYTQRFFDHQEASGVQYSAMGHITKPLEVLPGGYISWHNLTEDIWYQATNFGTFAIRSLGHLNMKGKSIREQIDQLTPVASRKPSNELVADAANRHKSILESSRAGASRLQSLIKGLTKS